MRGSREATEGLPEAATGTGLGSGGATAGEAQRATDSATELETGMATPTASGSVADSERVSARSALEPMVTVAAAMQTGAAFARSDTMTMSNFYTMSMDAAVFDVLVSDDPPAVILEFRAKPAGPVMARISLSRASARNIASRILEAACSPAIGAEK